MSDDDLRHLFNTVLTAPPPDTTDIDAAIRTGRRHTAWASAATVVAVLAIAVAAAWPSLHRTPASPGPGPAGASAPLTPDDGVLVTDAHKLLGVWQTIDLDGTDVRTVRDGGGQPLEVKFLQLGAQLNWGANDLTNFHSGIYSVSRSGVFRAHPGVVTAVGVIGSSEQYLRNPEAVEEATEARLVAATSAAPARLLLLAHEKLVAVYVAAAPSPAHS